MKINISIEIQPSSLFDLMVTFVESGISTFWCGLAEFKLDNEIHSYQDPKLYEGKWSLTLHPAVDDDFKPVTITEESFAHLDGTHPAVGRWFREDSSFDAGDADLIIQFLAFKEEVYA